MKKSTMCIIGGIAGLGIIGSLNSYPDSAEVQNPVVETTPTAIVQEVEQIEDDIQIEENVEEVQPSSIEIMPQKEEKKQVKYVYVTNNGKKYHKKGCSYLKDSCIEVSIDSAVKQGLGPCKKCNP